MKEFHDVLIHRVMTVERFCFSCKNSEIYPFMTTIAFV